MNFIEVETAEELSELFDSDVYIKGEKFHVGDYEVDDFIFTNDTYVIPTKLVIAEPNGRFISGLDLVLMKENGEDRYFFWLGGGISINRTFIPRVYVDDWRRVMQILSNADQTKDGFIIYPDNSFYGYNYQQIEEDDWAWTYYELTK